MRLYFDSAYIAKCYLNEPDAEAVRSVARRATSLCSSAWCRAEVASVFLRHRREGTLTLEQANQLQDLFRQDLVEGVWVLSPLSDLLLYRVETALRSLPSDVTLRAGDAVHLATAADSGFDEIWSNDRRLLAAAVHFGLAGKSVS